MRQTICVRQYKEAVYATETGTPGCSRDGSDRCSRFATAQTQMQIYGAWHCGSDFCTWGSVRNMTDFDTKNHWIIDRGDGSGLPSVNLVILSFVNPLKLLNKTNDAQTSNGVPIGMTSAI